MIAWLVAFMVSVSPPSLAVKFRGELDVDLVTSRYESLAKDVLSVTSDPNEKLSNPSKSALRLIAQAFCESAFDWRVDSGKCVPGTCDHGQAWSIWQLHAEDGLIFDGPRFTYARNRSESWKLDHFGEISKGGDLIRDRKLAARYALHMARVSPQLWSTWKCASDSASLWVSRHPYQGSAQ